ncbi:exodeoxyribonuclease V alpha subunit [Natronocella acetinitrilica]|uniref:Exodeoxyribonuclease V alpha subunit n=1 Tax=Natronocella acetinitrilica TaxID=414046 RepID=A0AAE3G1Y7_9GAMM|nr:AAA family ATPase [Natronocella acetinitrilica]MCP1674190.1 exodeoxyribonuclease V alpha subunit [Natronocella acetinitrilica]
MAAGGEARDLRIDGVVLRAFAGPGFSLLRLKAFGREALPAAAVDRDGVVAVYCPTGVIEAPGGADAIQAGQRLTVRGALHRHPQKGLQLRAARAYPTPKRQHTREILRSSFFPGISREVAERLWKAFGYKVFEAIETRPADVASVAGLEPRKMAYIADDLARFRDVEDDYFFLGEHGLDARHRDHVVQVFGARTRPHLSASPFDVLGVSGCPWSSADALAQSLGVAADSDQRIAQALEHAFRKGADAGHTALPERGLLRKLEAELSLPPARIRDVLEEAIGAGELCRVQDSEARSLFAAPHAAKVEQGIALHLARLARAPAPRDRFVPGPEDHFLSGEQRAAVNLSLQQKVAVMTGGPGVGKTTVLRSMLNQSERAFPGLRIALAAPTGKAAQRMNESTGREARTIHSLLEYCPEAGFRRHAGNPLEVDVLAVDEFSMVDAELCYRLLEALPDHARLILVGDRDQLPSVSAGAVLADLIGSGVVPVAALTQVQRQGLDSQIVANAHRVNRGEMPLVGEHGGDFHWIHAEDDQRIARYCEETLTRTLIGEHGMALADCQVITPQKRTPAGVDALNLRLRDQVNPRRQGQWFRHYRTEFRVGDRIMQTRNDKRLGIANGDIGRIVTVAGGGRQVVASFHGRDLALSAPDFDTMRLAYAITTHKSQGSEYQGVVFAVSGSHVNMLTPRLVYTAMTRAKGQLYMVGDMNALRRGLANDRSFHRMTGLQAQLQRAFADIERCPEMLAATQAALSETQTGTAAAAPPREGGRAGPALSVDPSLLAEASAALDI